jgi:hypothetical protein
MTNLSKIQNTSTRTSIVKRRVLPIKKVRLELILLLTLVLILYSIKNNLIINTIVVYEDLEWNTNTHMLLNLYRPIGCLGGVYV